MAYPVTPAHTNSIWHSISIDIHVSVWRSIIGYSSTFTFSRGACHLRSVLWSTVVDLLFKDLRFSLLDLLLCPPLLIQFSEKVPTLFRTASCNTVLKLGSNCIQILCLMWRCSLFLLCYSFLWHRINNNNSGVKIKIYFLPPTQNC